MSNLRVWSGGFRHFEFGEIVLLEFDFGVQPASFLLRGDAGGFDLDAEVAVARRSKSSQDSETAKRAAIVRK